MAPEITQGHLFWEESAEAQKAIRSAGMSETNPLQFTTAADVYSYGIVLWEVSVSEGTVGELLGIESRYEGSKWSIVLTGYH